MWGDVLTGIGEFVTAAFLTLRSGTMNAECLFDTPVVVYQFNRLALWVPYGVKLFFCIPLTNDLTFFLSFFFIKMALYVTLFSLVLAIMIMMKHTRQITTSFSDTIMVTRRVEDMSADVKLRLRIVNGGEPEYTIE
jgi:hypothetical protein